MTTVSVPLPPELLQAIEMMVKMGKAPNKAALIRMAIKWYAEEQAIQDVLEARKEPRLEGDLDELAKKIC